MQPVKVLNSVLGSGILPSGGDTKFVLAGHLIGSYLVGIPAAVLLGTFAGFNALGVFGARALEEIVKVIAFFSDFAPPRGTGNPQKSLWRRQNSLRHWPNANEPANLSRNKIGPFSKHKNVSFLEQKCRCSAKHIMATVRSLGQGYYGIESDGVVISKSVRNAVNEAFAMAESLSRKKLNIRMLNDSRRAADEKIVFRLQYEIGFCTANLSQRKGMVSSFDAASFRFKARCASCKKQ